MDNKILQGDALEVLKTLPDEPINMCMTSPPYWGLRDYGDEKQLGLEKDFNDYINKLCNIFDEVKRVLKKDGSCWVNLGDTYSNDISNSNYGGEGNSPLVSNTKNGIQRRWTCKSLPNKCLCQIPQRFSIEMTNRGWILRNIIIWHKKNAMPSSVKDRFTVDFEYLFFFVKNKSYYFEQQFDDCGIHKGRVLDNRESGHGKARGLNTNNDRQGNFKNHENGRNKRTVWTINPKPFNESHFAVYPEELCHTPIKAGCPENGIVLDPFFGSGTTGAVSLKLNRKYLGIELNQEYIDIANKRLQPLLEQGKLF